jgi:hypothetical protein
MMPRQYLSIDQRCSKQHCLVASSCKRSIFAFSLSIRLRVVSCQQAGFGDLSPYTAKVKTTPNQSVSSQMIELAEGKVIQDDIEGMGVL